MLKNTENNGESERVIFYDCKEKSQFILAIDNYIKTIKSDEISDNDLIEYLKREMKKNETI